MMPKPSFKADIRYLSRENAKFAFCFLFVYNRTNSSLSPLFHMELSVRAYIFDTDDRILLVKHSSEQPRVLPGGHVEKGEDIYTALKREVLEELGMDIILMGAENTFSAENVAAMPLPVSVHKISYEHRTRGQIEKLEFFFFARSKNGVKQVQTEEIARYERFEMDEILEMEADMEVFSTIQEVLDQNADLLELVG